MTGSYDPEWQWTVQDDDLKYAEPQEIDALARSRRVEEKSYSHSPPTTQHYSSQQNWEYNELRCYPSGYSFSSPQEDYNSVPPPAPMPPGYDLENQYIIETENIRQSSSRHPEPLYPPWEEKMGSSTARYDSYYPSSSYNKLPYQKKTTIRTSGTAAFRASASGAPFMHRTASSNYSNSPPEGEYHYPVPEHSSRRHSSKHYHHSAAHYSTNYPAHEYHDQHHYSNNKYPTSIKSYSAFSEKPRYGDYYVSSGDSSRASSAGSVRPRVPVFYEEKEPFTRYK